MTLAGFCWLSACGTILRDREGRKRGGELSCVVMQRLMEHLRTKGNLVTLRRAAAPEQCLSGSE
jgi:hypothetical protein